MTAPSGVQAQERVLVLRVGAERVALPVRALRELVDAPTITPVPLAPAALCGHCSLRGQHLPVLDLGVLLGIARDGADVRIAAVAAEGGYALAVDDALDVWEPEDAVLRPLPAARGDRRLLAGVLHRGAQLAALADDTALRNVALATLRTETAQ